MKRPRYYPYLPPVPDQLLTKQQVEEQRENYRKLAESQANQALIFKFITIPATILLAILFIYMFSR